MLPESNQCVELSVTASAAMPGTMDSLSFVVTVTGTRRAALVSHSLSQ